MAVRERRLDLVAFAAIALLIVLFWLPTLTSGSRLRTEEDILLYVSRHEAVRKSLVEYRTFPLRSHWFGGGFPTLGEPEDPALNPLVVLSLVFGPIMGLKLIGFVAALVSGLGTYGLARHILRYTWWGALFSGSVVGTSLFVPVMMWGGNPHEVCVAYLPLCVLLVGLACRGRPTALFLLPLILYAMLVVGKQAFFMSVFFLVLLCLLNAVPALRTLGPGTTGRPFDGRAIVLLALCLAAALLIGMVRILPVLEFIDSQGGFSNVRLHGHTAAAGIHGVPLRDLAELLCSIGGRVSVTTVGSPVIAVFAVAACWSWRQSLPWVIIAALFSWLVVADEAPVDLFGLLARLPIFSAITVPEKYFSFQVVLSIALGAGQIFRLLSRLRHRWLEHVCALVLMVLCLGFIYPRSLELQHHTYPVQMPSVAPTQAEEFHNVQGRDLPRNRAGPPRAIAYMNLLRNVGTIDWYVAIPIAEHAIPRYFVDSSNRLIPNADYRAEVFFVDEAGPGAASSTGGHAPATSVTSWTFRPNSITVDVTVGRPGVLVANQNYHPAWNTDRGELFERDGLIALRLSETGSYTIRLSYLPRSFVVGSIVSLLSLAAWAVVCWNFGTRRACRWAETRMP